MNKFDSNAPIPAATVLINQNNQPVCTSLITQYATTHNRNIFTSVINCLAAFDLNRFGLCLMWGEE